MAGLYSPAAVGLREDKQIKDDDFISELCLIRARNNPDKIKYPGDNDSWITREMLPNVNMGYCIFHFSPSSPFEGYTYSFDERYRYTDPAKTTT